MNRFTTPTDRRYKEVSVSFDPETDMVYITAPRGSFARVGQSQFKRTVLIPGHDLVNKSIWTNDSALPEAQRSFVWFNRSPRRVILPLSIANHDLLLKMIDEVEAQRMDQQVVSAVHDYLKAPPP